MLTYSFSEIGSMSLYEYLYQCIKNDILTGVLAPGDRLPSKRSFARHLNISAITVENAYGQLLAEGYIYSIPKKGYYTADISTSIPRPSFPVSAPPETALEPEEEPCFADFTSSQTHPDTFPFSIWTKLMREVIGDDRFALMKNSPSGGIFPLRQAIVRHLKEFRGMTVHPEQIIVGAGTEYLYGILIQLLGFQKIYGVEDPGYQKISSIYKSHRVACRHIPMDGQGINIQKLRELDADIVHISPSHHFPTGVITPVSRRYELLGWAAESEERYIIEDDYDCEFRFMGKPIPSLQSIDVMEKVIYMNTFTKTLASTIRISYMALPAHLMERFHQNMGFYSCTVSNFEQYTLTRFLQDGHFERHINRMRNFYHSQRDLLLDCLKNSPLSSRITITEEDAGLHFLMHVDASVPDDLILQKARAKGLRIASLSQYYSKEPAYGQHTFIMNYSAIHPDHMEEAIARLCQVFGEAEATAPAHE
ncbi:PLP-dependent aminotransferase family protein [Petralouisia muris]|jgi:GntR family transcriptional regulator/MocR family aminotransferase|uniref:PLP-dependent aminotransferase family protein n=1 Tax=Petralouisia muris TaxID=3032872 RepID=A0AC61RQC6_9FIRM|nr:PLP-dependent aminotransferase family protein [Petralouisia muris]TGY91134.1 PLP-dependent aminotransferase family protein [Petralouisia muris]